VPPTSTLYLQPLQTPWRNGLMPLGRPWRAPGAPAPSLGGGVFIKRGKHRGKKSEFQGPLPSLNADDTVDGWERRFWETDGWEVPDTLPAPISADVNAAPAKWWHVSDERILEMLQGQDSRSVAVEEVQPEEPVEDLSPPLPSHGSVTPDNEKEKVWKVSDEELERLVQEMQRQTAATGLATHLQGALKTRREPGPNRVPTIRLYLSVGSGVLVIQVPEDLPLDLSEADETAQALRQQKTLRPRRKASIALERLLGAPSPTSLPPNQAPDPWPLCLTAVIESLTKIPRRNQRLIHQKRIIRPKGTLKELGIFDGHELTLVPKVSKGAAKATPLTLQSGALHLIEPWRWDEKPKLLARKQEKDAGFLSSEVHLPNADDQTLCRLRTQLGIVK